MSATRIDGLIGFRTRTATGMHQKKLGMACGLLAEQTVYCAVEVTFCFCTDVPADRIAVTRFSIAGR